MSYAQFMEAEPWPKRIEIRLRRAPTSTPWERLWAWLLAPLDDEPPPFDSAPWPKQGKRE